MHLTELDYHGQPIFVPGRPRGAAGAAVRLQVFASDVALATSAPRDLSVRNVLQGTVAGIEEEQGGAFALVTVDVAGGRLRAQLTRQAVSALGLTMGQQVYALLKTATFDQR
ncbi:MAG: TOBE domain-containing protein [Woeseiaceae bacterium]|nr:TOBE domain-containing protein [Woeseiaceae bacterium]